MLVVSYKRIINVRCISNGLSLLEEFFHSSGLAVNVEKTKLMVVQTIQPHHYPVLTYRDEHIQFVQRFKYLGIDVPATNKWSACLEII